MTAIDEVRRKGFALLRTVSDDQLHDLLARLGHVIHTEDVLAEGGGQALVSSRRPLSPHTDHHSAHHIVWRCVRPAQRGGESEFVDGLAIYHALSPRDQRALREVVLAEHRLFEGDVDAYPMVRDDPAGGVRLYYSFWLGGDLVGAPREAFERFSRATQAVRPHRVRLEAGDVLVVDNHRMLHGRTGIGEGCRRHLVRWWCAPQAVAAA